MTEAKVHALVLKVMRLAKPKFFEPPTMSVDPADEFATDIQAVVNHHTGHESMEIPLSDFLLCPQSIDNIYLGETFTFYISILNASDIDVCTNLSIQAHIQTQTQKIHLSSKFKDAQAKLEPKQTIGQNISHEIKEVGQHILVCEVNYKLNNVDEMNLRKYFKFPVEKPVDVRTKFFSAEDNLSNDVYLEAQIQNLCNSSIVLEKVELQPSEYYRRNDAGAGRSKVKHIQLNPQDVYQYLFCLSPNITDHSLTQFRGVSVIGKLDIGWRSSMGEAGILQTSPLTRTNPNYGDLRVLIDKMPGQVPLKQLFHIDCRVLNCSERSLDLVLTLDNENKRPFLFASVSGIHLGQILPNAYAKFHLEVLALQSGIQSLSGIRITDTFLKRTYELDNLAQILVN